jgi:hypothetical protein
MYEKVVTALYLANHPDKSADFAAYRAVQWYRLLTRIPVNVRDSLLGPERVKEIEEDYQEAVPRFTNPTTKKIRASWTLIPLDELAKQAKDELDGIYRPLHEAYTPAFAFPSCFIHASLTDLLGRVETENGLTYIADNKARSPQSTLFHAHLLLLRLFNRLNSHFSV